MDARAWALANMVPPHLRGVEPYVPSVPDDELKRLYGCEKLHRLNNNENALGPCPAALRALADFESGDVKTYPSGDCFHLREAIASRFSLDPGHVVVGNGANEVISFAIRGFCEKGDKVVLPDRTFAVCEWQAQHCGCDIALIPLSGSFNDLDALRDAIDSRTKLVYVCNPNNPTGGFHGRAALKSFLEGVAGRAVVVIDEAYIEFVENYEAESCVPLLSEHPNLLLFRTFSQAFALAGLRIGYALCSEELSEALRRVRTVYSVNSYSQVAALACVEPSAETDEHLAKTRRMVAESKAILTSRFDALGLRHMEGEGNFVMAELPFDDALAYRMLMRQGYMVRTMTGFRFPNWIRVTCVQPQVMEGFCEALTGILESRRRK